jgi:hypothetical protein
MGIIRAITGITQGTMGIIQTITGIIQVTSGIIQIHTINIMIRRTTGITTVIRSGAMINGQTTLTSLR